MKIFYHEDYRLAALCRGVLATAIREETRGVKAVQAALEKVKEVDVPYSIEELSNNEDYWSGKVKIFFDSKERIFTLNPDWEDDEFCNRYHRYTIVNLKTTVLPAGDYDGEYPYACFFSRQEDGRLSGRINYRSDTDGCFQKLVFPDRSWKLPVAGDCRVKIVKDLPGYAFVTGTNEIFGTPATLDDVIQSLWDSLEDKKLDIRSLVFEVKDSLAGSFVGMIDSVGHFAFVKDGDKVTQEFICPNHRQELVFNLAANTVWKMAAEDLLVQYAFDCFNSADELFSQFRLSVCSGDTHTNSHSIGYWREVNGLGTNAPKVAYEANDLGVISRKELLTPGCSATAIAVDRSKVFLLAQFSDTELFELVRFVNNTNTDADEKVRGAVKKGKLSLSR